MKTGKVEKGVQVEMFFTDKEYLNLQKRCTRDETPVDQIHKILFSDQGVIHRDVHKKN
jgi:hypothetical protein